MVFFRSTTARGYDLEYTFTPINRVAFVQEWDIFFAIVEPNENQAIPFQKAKKVFLHSKFLQRFRKNVLQRFYTQSLEDLEQIYNRVK